MERCWRRTGSPGNSGLPPLPWTLRLTALPSPQPWGFPAREFLRKKLIGKEVCFTVEYKTPQGREYGMVYLGKGGCGGSFGVGWDVPSAGGCLPASPSLLHHFSISFPWPPSFGGEWGVPAAAPPGFRSSSPALPAPGAFPGSAWNVLSTNAAGKPPLVGMECWDTLSAAGGCIPTFPWIPSFGRGAVPGADPG